MIKKSIAMLLSVCMILTLLSTEYMMLEVHAEETIEMDGVTYTIANSKATVSGCTGTEEEIVLPDSITDGSSTYPVVKIANKTFQGESVLKTLVLPSTLETIGKYFINGTQVTSITIPKNVTSMTDAFLDNEVTTCVTLEEGITTVPEYAFCESKENNNTRYHYSRGCDLSGNQHC